MRFQGYRSAALVPVLALSILVGTVPPTQADVGQSILNINEPLEIPGKVLEPGTYLVRVVRTQGKRDVVEFLSPDMLRIHAKVLTVMTDKREPATEHAFEFIPTGERQAPRALRAWTFAGSQFGHEFIYNQERVAAFGRVSTIKPMITMTEEMEQELTSASVNPPATSQMAAAGSATSTTTPQGQRPYAGTVMTDTQPPAGSMAPIQVASAEQARTGAMNTTGTKQVPQGDESKLPRVLPRTADSTTPLLAIAGLALVLGGLGLRRIAARPRP